MVRLALIGAVLGLCAGLESKAFAQDKAFGQDEAPNTVLELFTSQGCSSCPPADALLGELAKRPRVLALTMPVNYWDYLGWKDTLASESFSKRQRGYAEARGDHEIYTPQLVINGLTHLVGSRKEAIEGAIERTRQTLRPAHVAVKLSAEGDSIHIEAAAAPAGGEHRSGTVWLAVYSSAVDVAIGRGENYGRKITYTNVVRKLVPAGRWEGEAASFDIARPKSETADGCAAFLQADKTNAIIGAAILTPKTN